MKKVYVIKNNQFIIYPNTKKEKNITEEFAECKYCARKPKTECGHYNSEIDYPACDWFTFGDDWEEAGD